jgi:hypothetical protein
MILSVAITAITIALGTATHDRQLLLGRTPTFARQTKLSCAVCHLGGFPQLSRFGRLFKLNGYTLSKLESIPEQSDSGSRPSLALAAIPGLSTMAVISATSVAKALPGASGTRAEFPQQLSLLFGGEIAPHLGALAELSYSDRTAKLAIDNTDIRFANHAQLNDRDLLYGVTLHNNPTVQDVWNTLPTWSFPFVSPALAPRPAAMTQLDGGLAQSVLGLGAYGFFDNVLYAELSGYTSAPQRAPGQIDSASRAIRDVAPYWRVAVQNRHGPVYLMAGTFGMVSQMAPAGAPRAAGSPADTYVDVGGDAQLERSVGRSFFVAHANYTHENQDLAGSSVGVLRTASNSSNTLDSWRLSMTYGPASDWSFGASYFASSGSTDRLLYPAASITGSRTGDPGSNGELAEVTVNPWLNARIGLQYLMYQRFNGSSASYDLAAAGRSAKDNNSLFLYFWFAY